jgi:hypothetical protein
MTVSTFGLSLEDAVVGGLLLNGCVPEEIRADLSVDMFSPQRRVIARAIFAVAARVGSCDLIAVLEELRRNDADIDASQVVKLSEAVPSSSHLIAHARLLREQAGPDEVGKAEGFAALAFPESAWRGPFALYRKAMDGTSEAPDTVHFSTLWANAAARLRRRVHIYYAFDHFPNVFLVNYGTTGDSKTSAMRQGFRVYPTDAKIKVLRGLGSAEALGAWMHQPDDGPRISHLIFLEELATVLTRGRWEGSTLLHFLTETFDCPPVYEAPYRKNPLKVKEPTPILLAGTTAEWFWRSIREVDFHGGFGNRLLFLTGVPKAPISMPAKPDAVHLRKVQAALDALESGFLGELSLAPDALALWDEFYRAWKKTEWDPLTTAATKRIPAYILKLAMIYACFEGTAPTITLEQIEAAIQVGYFATRCSEQLMGCQRQHTVQGRCEQRILKVLSREDLPKWKIHRRIGGHFSAEETERALRSLKSLGLIQEIGATSRGEAICGLRSRLRS